MHYKAPYIPLILTWPDLNKSKDYLEETLQNVPDHLRAKYYLADTLYKLGEKDKAKQYYKEVLTAPLSNENYYEDLSLQKECRRRYKKLKF